MERLTKDVAQAKAWGKSRVAIANETNPAIITRALLVLLLQTRVGGSSAQDEKALAKQERR